MYRTSKRIAALSMAAALLASQTAYAQNVVTAQQPGTTAAQGPTAEKQYNEKGYLVIDGQQSDPGFVNAGPGLSGNVQGTGTESSKPGTEQNPTPIDSAAAGSAQQNQTQAGSAQGTTGNQIAIDESVAKPEIASEAAALYDATTGQFLYEKNGDKAMYPASTTKLMTALLAVEKLKLDDTITFSQTATTNLESGASNVNIVAGDKLSVKDALYALLLKSACEVANGLGEAVSGSEAQFAALMNQRAKELGATNTNFQNASGLNSASHYTTAHDMALITKAALDNETIRSILQTRSYTLPASQKRGELQILNGNKMSNKANAQYYDGFIGGKTGYTSKAGNTLATGVEKNGHELIAVVLKSQQKQYEDTKKLLDYGYELIAKAGSQNTAAGSSQTGSTQTQNGQTSAGQAQNSQANAGQAQDSQAAAGGKWVQNGSSRQYQKADGSFYRNEWLDLDGKTYFFGSDTNMCTGWKQFTNGAWYYFNPEDGSMVTNKWVTQDGKSYYLQSDGTMAKNTVIDGIYKVDASGVYVEKLG